MRNAFSKSLVEAAKANSKVMLLTGDHGYSLFDEFRKECPNQFINCGIAEQNMVGMAAGLAKSGFYPVVYGLSAFIPIRVLEQIKLDVCYENLPVIFIGDGAGVVYSTLGVSHQSTEDISALRAIPNINILSPGDAYEMEACMNLAFLWKRPTYLRMGKGDLGLVRTWKDDLPSFCQMDCLHTPLAIVATGSMLFTAKKLASHFYCDYYSAQILKPLSFDDIYHKLNGHTHIVTLEEHNIMGGLGSIICEIMSETGIRIRRIGIEDRFSGLCGSYDYLMKEHGLDFDSIKNKIEKFIN